MARKKSAIANRKFTVSRAAWARIRLLAMDVDGVLTDGTVQISSAGTESKSKLVLLAVIRVFIGRWLDRGVGFGRAACR